MVWGASAKAGRFLMSMVASGYTKISANLPDSTVEVLKALAARRHTTMTETLKSAIELAEYLSSRAERGDKILVGNGSEFTQIVVPPLIPR
jgi:hypothetical protein